MTPGVAINATFAASMTVDCQFCGVKVVLFLNLKKTERTTHI
jgi:hypothetical protein